ncbi:MAG TPA: cyclopropane-fatty-acyl-phospholipid synthase family protein [Acidobacteriota bacterium]|jgi:cyclopropane-fatty-acyl-phospholipid synthase
MTDDRKLNHLNLQTTERDGGMSGISAVERRLLSEVLRRVGNPPIHFTLWNGEQIARPGNRTVAGIVFRDRAIMLKFLWHPELYFGEGYETGRIEVQGDLVQLIETVYQNLPRFPRASRQESTLRWWNRFLRYGAAGGSMFGRRKNTTERSRRNIHRHYDIGNSFYKLWLDSNLVYTCAYFPSPEDDLEKAQVEKMDLVCRKVRLQPGESVVDAGCGWGALALHMARHYGATVKAFNISREQILYARQRAREEGLQGRVEFIEDDYRNISGRFDVFVSIGMLEHVGLGNYAQLASVIDRSLTDQGRGLLHFIGRNRQMALNPWILRRIFPGAYPPSIRQAMKIFESQDLSVLDLENLRLHYAKTLQHWLDRFENSADIVQQMFGRSFVRAWRLYLASSVASFLSGYLQLFQVTFTRAANNQIPWTRAYLYASNDLQPAGAALPNPSVHAEM